MESIERAGVAVPSRAVHQRPNYVSHSKLETDSSLVYLHRLVLLSSFKSGLPSCMVGEWAEGRHWAYL